MMIIQVPMPRLPKGATMEQRLEAYFDWCEAMRKCNPMFWLPIGVKKRRFIHLLKIEHPFTRELEIPSSRRNK